MKNNTIIYLRENGFMLVFATIIAATSLSYSYRMSSRMVNSKTPTETHLALHN